MAKKPDGVIEELDLFPLDYVFLLPRQKVQALTSRNGLVKGEPYWLKAVHSSGKVVIHDKPGQLFDMGCFIGIRTFTEAPANDNAAAETPPRTAS